jgi:molybdopterin synthase catalytic subunit
MVCFSSKPIDPRQVYDLIEKNAAGSVLFHFAVAKAMGAKHGTTTHISYEPNGDVEQGLKDIAAEMREKWNLADVLLLRRQGMVAVGEIISLVAVSSSGSEEAFAACRHGLACMKRMPTIIKTEIYS